MQSFQKTQVITQIQTTASCTEVLPSLNLLAPASLEGNIHGEEFPKETHHGLHFLHERLHKHEEPASNMYVNEKNTVQVVLFVD